MRNLILPIIFVGLGAGAGEKQLPEGIKQVGYYEVKLTKLTDAAITHLNEGKYKNKPSFRVRLLAGVDATDLTRLGELPWIRRLSVPPVDNVTDVAFLKPLENLEAIQLWGPRMTDYTALGEVKKLEVVDFQGGQVKDIGFAKQLSKLRDLNLHGVTTIEDYGPLAGLSNLTRLSVASHRKGAKELAPVATLENLVCIGLARYPERDLSLIANCRKLRRVDCIFAGQLEDISALSNMPDLERVVLWGTKVKDISPLDGCKSLNMLNLRDTPVTDLTPLHGIASLRHLYVPKDLPEEAVAAIKKAIPDLTVRR